MRGRKPKPTAQKVREGNAGKRPLDGVEPDFPVGAITPPSWLSKIARAEWKRIVPQLLEQGLFTVADRASFAGYCESYATWRAAQAIIEKEGLTVLTPQGFMQQRPEVSIAKQNLAQVLKFASEFGLTPVARVRLKVEGRGGKKSDREDDEFFKAQRSGQGEQRGAVQH